jgi:phage tail-like protein
MAISGSSSATAALKAASRGQLGAYPSYGMAMRFEVKVEGLSLGHWRSCTGLEVKLESKPIPQGGEYTRLARLPESLVYKPITLERAMSAKDSKILQTWLHQFVKKWELYPTTPTGIYRTTAVITLLDHQLLPVMDWTLQGVYPSSWSGPRLSADDNKVAIESLVIEHEGFLEDRQGAT